MNQDRLGTGTQKVTVMPGISPAGESRLLRLLVLIENDAMSASLAADHRLVLDFRERDQVVGWFPVDDRVMGGISASRVDATEEGLMFHGQVSLANQGGFASIRNYPRDYELAGTTALILRVLGDGKIYKFGLRLDEAFDGVQYQAAFASRAQEWQDILLPITDFLPNFRGRLVAAPPLAPARIRVLGLLIAGRQAGPFRLVVASLHALGGKEWLKPVS